MNSKKVLPMNHATSADQSASLSDPNGGIQQIRESFLETTLLALTVLGIIAAPITVWRSSYTGWIPTYTGILFLTGVLTGLYLLRKQVSVGFKGATLVTILLLIGFNGFQAHGVYAPSITFLILAHVVTAILYSKPVVLSLMMPTTMAMTILAYGFVSGYWTPTLDLNASVSTPGVWISMIVLVLGGCLIIILSISVFIRSISSMAMEIAMQRDAATLASEERRVMEEKLRESQKLEAIGQLTGGLAHDFNNLMGIVVGNLDEIGESLPRGDARLRAQHRAALDAALRGAEVTRSLLAVARRQPLEVGTYNVNALLAEFVPLAKSSAGSAVAVGSDLAPGDLPARLDAAGLSNVILNLVINARDAMQDSTDLRRITLRTRRVHIAPDADEALTPGWYALLEVVDTGAGMSEQIRAQAFDPFFTTKERGHGTGLGLAMVFGYATQLGGTARIQSEPGRGTTVQLYLPMEAQAAVAAEAQFDALVAEQAEALICTRDPRGAAPDVVLSPLARTTTPSAPVPLGTPRGQRVLVVDDEVALCELACGWLESLGYQPTGVHSPAAALECMADEPFDTLFTDIVMPGGMDGLALAREARSRYPHLRIILTSGYAQSLTDTPDWLVTTLPGSFLSKPYRKNNLAKHFPPLPPPVPGQANSD